MQLFQLEQIAYLLNLLFAVEEAGGKMMFAKNNYIL